MAIEHPNPSEHARHLVRGAYDLHVHIEPDIIPRRIGDIELAQRFLARGMAGFVLKSHYTSTAERATLVRQSVAGIDVRGALVLNNPVGGLNPLAVEIAARSGARIIWMPTIDAANEANEQHTPGVKRPLWARLQQEFHEQGIAQAAIGVFDRDGQLQPALLQVLAVIAKHQLVLATGHLSRNEILAVVAAGQQAGIKQIVVTHPDYPTQNLAIADQVALAQQGVLLERCLAPAYTGKVAWERMLEAIRACGPAASVISTDLGQPTNPPVEDGLAIMADWLIAQGFSDNDIQIMIVQNSRRIALGAGENQ